MKRIAINGLGRIGRSVLHHYVEIGLSNMEIVVANDFTPTNEMAYLLRYDSVHGWTYNPIEHKSDYVTYNSKRNKKIKTMKILYKNEKRKKKNLRNET